MRACPMNPHTCLDRRRWLQQAAALTLGALPLGRAMASAEPFPSRPVTLWVPWPAGGATDISLRVLADLASATLGQPVLTENRGARKTVCGIWAMV